MLTGVGFTSSACTGSYSGEMALSLVEKTVNDSKMLDIPVFFTPIRCHVPQTHWLSTFKIHMLHMFLMKSRLVICSCFPCPGASKIMAKRNTYLEYCFTLNLEQPRKSRQRVVSSSLTTTAGALKLLAGDPNRASMVILQNASLKEVLIQMAVSISGWWLLIGPQWKPSSIASPISKPAICLRACSPTTICPGCLVPTCLVLGRHWRKKAAHPQCSHVTPRCILRNKRHYLW